MANGTSSSTCQCDCKSKVEELTANIQEQAKVNAELKKLLVGVIGSDVGILVESMAKDKLSLHRELSEVKTQVEKGTDDIDNLTAQADTWRSKYLAVKIALRDAITWKITATKQLDEMKATLQDFMTDHDRLWASVACTYSALAALCKQSAQGICFIPDKPPHGSVIHIAEVNQKLARCLFTVFGKQTTGACLTERQPIAEPTQAAKKTLALLISHSTLFNQNNANFSPTNRDTLVERFHPSVTRPESDGPIVCKGCKGSVIVL